ncbi:sigma-70 family RNA polymerase sigma factor, partial [Microbacterium sp. NPDC089321]|uniref:sigma-70 family RNA polymerase sigma factor n=1 Tax=Microbacterium sp. NPDC089321 TaxID=3155183 RepID=UPI003419638A
EALDRGLTAQAFRSLPSRWQEVLWYSEIEQMKPAEIAPLLGMSTGAVSQLSFRAREGLREAWIQAHLRNAGEDSECHWTIENLGAHSRGNLGSRAQQRVDRHLESCARCMIVAAEAQDVSNRLALVLLPLVLGVSGASAYLASLQTGSTPVAALAAMPSSVVEGAVVVTGTSGAAVTSAGAGAPAGADASAGAAASAGSSSGSVSGIGALVGAGSAALIVAGVVAAAAVVPAMMSATPATSRPSASDPDSSSIASEVAPDDSMKAGEPVMVEVDDERQTAPAPKAPVAPDTPVDDAAAEAPRPALATPSPLPTADETPDPSESLSPEPSESPSPTPTPTISPGPGSTTSPPPTETPKPTPPTPTETPSPEPKPTGFTVYAPISGGENLYRVPVSGTPGAVAQVWMRAEGRPESETVLDEDGDGSLLIQPNQAELSKNAELTFLQLVDGVTTDTTLIDLFSLLTDLPPFSSVTAE